MDKEILANLQRLGLNQYESKTYLALANTSAETARELSDAADIPRPRVYDVLKKLEKRGFVTSKPGRPTKYSSVPISAAINSLKRKKKKDHKDDLQEIENIEETLVSMMEVEEEKGFGEEEVHVLKDRKNIYSVLGELIKNAQNHVLLSSDKEGLQRKKEEYGKHLDKAENRGVEVNFHDSDSRLAIVDDHALLFLSDSSLPEHEKAVWLKSPYVANNLKELH